MKSLTSSASFTKQEHLRTRTCILKSMPSWHSPSSMQRETTLTQTCLTVTASVRRKIPALLTHMRVRLVRLLSSDGKVPDNWLDPTHLCAIGRRRTESTTEISGGVMLRQMMTFTNPLHDVFACGECSHYVYWLVWFFANRTTLPNVTASAYLNRTLASMVH